jgi:hypothetical protein
MVQDPIAGMPLLRAMSVQGVVEVLQDCFVEFLIYCLSSSDVLMTNRDNAVFHWEDICFVSGSYP